MPWILIISPPHTHAPPPQTIQNQFAIAYMERISEMRDIFLHFHDFRYGRAFIMDNVLHAINIYLAVLQFNHKFSKQISI